MGSLAADLKTEREKRNVSLAQIAADTHISLHFLESLEGGRYGELPGGMYNRAFLRAYCESLNLNQQEILQRFEGEIGSPAEKAPKSRVQISQKSSPLKPNPILIWSLALLISAAGIFFSRHWIGAVFSPYFSHRPPAVQPRELAQKPVAAPAEEKTAPQMSQPAEPSLVPSDTAPADSQPVQAAEPSVPAQSPAAADAANADSMPPPTKSSLQLEVGATEQCWVSVEQDGTRSFRKLMSPGDIQRLYASEQFFLIVGNAGGIQLKINGKPAKPLGKPGEVVKILINEKNLESFLVQSPG